MGLNNIKKAKILVLIPVIIFMVVSAILLPMTISYFSTGSDVTAVAMIITVTAALILTTIPCLVMSVAGTMYAARAKKEGMALSRGLFVIGIIEIIVCGLDILLMTFAVIITVIAAFR